VMRRQLRIRMLGDVGDREVVGDERVRERGERGEHEKELAGGDGTGCCQQSSPPGVRADETERGLRERERQGDDQREVAELRNHCVFLVAFWPAKAALSIVWPAFFSASAASGGM